MSTQMANVDDMDWDLEESDGDAQASPAPVTTETPAAVDTTPTGATAPTDTGPPPVEATAPPADSPGVQAKPAVDPPQATPEVAFSLPADAVPFAFKVDGIDAKLDGAFTYADHIVIPKDVWDRQFRPQFLGSRETWQRERAGYEQRLQETQSQQTAEVHQARATLEAFQSLLQQGPEAVADWLINFEQQAPLLMARAEANAARAQVEQFTSRQNQSRQAEQVSQATSYLANALTQEVDGLLADPALGVLADTPDEKRQLLAELWELGPRVFSEDQQGRLGVRRDALQQFLHQRASFLSHRIAKRTQAQATAQRNQAAVAPTAASPSPAKPVTAAAKPRDENGRFAAQDDKRAWRAEMDADFDELNI